MYTCGVGLVIDVHAFLDRLLSLHLISHFGRPNKIYSVL